MPLILCGHTLKNKTPGCVICSFHLVQHFHIQKFLRHSFSTARRDDLDLHSCCPEVGQCSSSAEGVWCVSAGRRLLPTEWQRGPRQAVLQWAPVPRPLCQLLGQLRRLHASCPQAARTVVRVSDSGRPFFVVFFG